MQQEQHFTTGERTFIQTSAPIQHPSKGQLSFRDTVLSQSCLEHCPFPKHTISIGIKLHGDFTGPPPTPANTLDTGNFRAYSGIFPK